VDIYDAILTILKADRKEYTSRELLEQIQARYSWTTKSRTPEKTLDARLARVAGDPFYPVEKRKVERGTVYFFSPTKLASIEAHLSPRPALTTEPLVLTVESKVAQSGRLDVDHLVSILRAWAESVRAFGRAKRGTGGVKKANYELELVAQPQPGSLKVELAPTSAEGREALESLLYASQRPRAADSITRKALVPLEGLRQLVGIGRPLRSFSAKWRSRPETVFDLVFDEQWFEALPDDVKPDQEYEWLSMVKPDSFVGVGAMDEIDKRRGSFRLTFDGGEAIFTWVEGTWREVDRDRWKRVAVLAQPEATALDLLKLDPRSTITVSGRDVFRAARNEVQHRLAVLERLPLRDELFRVLVILEWSALVAGTLLSAPQLTPEDEGGIGLWWRDPISRRELDLDYVEGRWRALKTEDGEALKSAADEAAVEALVSEADIETDSDLVELARWFVGAVAESEDQEEAGDE
jgi:hypothetical protein